MPKTAQDWLVRLQGFAIAIAMFPILLLTVEGRRRSPLGPGEVLGQYGLHVGLNLVVWQRAETLRRMRFMAQFNIIILGLGGLGFVLGYAIDVTMAIGLTAVFIFGAVGAWLNKPMAVPDPCPNLTLGRLCVFASLRETKLSTYNLSPVTKR